MKAICKYCLTSMTGKSSNGTNHLRRHLDRCSSYKSKSKQSLIGATNTSATWVFSQQESREILTQMFIAHELPFRLIEHTLFKALLASLQPKFKIHGRITLKSDIMKMFQKMKVELARDLSAIDCISLTKDLWTLSASLIPGTEFL